MSLKDRLGDTAGLLITRGPQWGDAEGQEHLADDLLGQAPLDDAEPEAADGGDEDTDD